MGARDAGCLCNRSELFDEALPDWLFDKGQALPSHTFRAFAIRIALVSSKTVVEGALNSKPSSFRLRSWQSARSSASPIFFSASKQFIVFPLSGS
jgi:hypothetical protein